MFKSAIWAFVGIVSSQISTFVFSVILARILSPEEFGQIALLLIFVAFCDIFVNGGFAVGLIQKKDSDDLDFSTIAVFSFAIAILCYIGLYCLSGRIAIFFKFKTEAFVDQLRILGIVIFPKMILSLQSAYCRKRFEFPKLYLILLISNIVGGVTAIILGKTGFGVYALIVQQILLATVASVLLFFVTDLHWSPRFSFERFKKLFNFSCKIFAIDFLNYCFQNIRSVIVGKKYPLESLGFFNRGNNYANLATATISSTLSAVVLPFLALEQDSKQSSKTIIRETVQVTSFFVYPLIFGMIACAKPLVRVILTDKWLPCTIFIQLFAMYGLWAKPQIICQEALKAKGLSNTVLYIEIIRKTFEIGLLLVAIKLGIEAIALSSSLACLVSWFPVIYFSNKELEYNYREQCFDIAASFLGGAIMGVAIYPLNYLSISPFYILLMQVITGISIYTVTTIVFKTPGRVFVTGKFLTFVKKEKNCLWNFLNRN